MNVDLEEDKAQNSTEGVPRCRLNDFRRSLQLTDEGVEGKRRSSDEEWCIEHVARVVEERIISDLMRFIVAEFQAILRRVALCASCAFFGMRFRLDESLSNNGPVLIYAEGDHF